MITHSIPLFDKDQHSMIKILQNQMLYLALIDSNHQYLKEMSMVGKVFGP